MWTHLIIKKEIPEGIGRFCREYGDRRITREALQYYDAPDEECVCWCAYIGETLVGISAAKITSERYEYSVTITHPEFRNQGIGTFLLRGKIEEAPQIYEAIVASDNGPSMRICQKNDLEEIGRIERERRSGPYQAVIYKERKEGNDAEPAGSSAGGG